MFLAANSLNQSLFTLMLLPSLRNQTENDLRHKRQIPIYSGMRQKIDCDFSGVIGFEATSLITLGFLDLVKLVFDTFAEIHLPHSICRWLFNEKDQAQFHQPNRFRNAHAIINFLSLNSVSVLDSSATMNDELSEQVGDELAKLIAEAENINSEDDNQNIVIRSSPVYRLSSLMEEEANLEQHYTVLSSCQSLVHKLQQINKITHREGLDASTYLQSVEKPWPNQPEIKNGATLFFDDLSIEYFIHIGLLDKLVAAGFKVILSPKIIARMQELISYESLSNKALEIMEELRLVINIGIKSGKVKLEKKQLNDNLEESWIVDHPTASLVELVENCDALVTDDRFINKSAFYGDISSKTPIFTTLDLIDYFTSSGILSLSDQIESRTKLRNAGYLFISVTEDELMGQLQLSKIVDGKINETAELKAIKESLLLVRMGEWLQMPNEAFWLNSVLNVFVSVLNDIWLKEADVSIAEAKSNWILENLNICGWAYVFGDKKGLNMIKYGYAKYIFRVLLPPIGISPKSEKAYFHWIERSLLDSIRRQDSDLYLQIVEIYKSKILNVATKSNERGEST